MAAAIMRQRFMRQTGLVLQPPETGRIGSSSGDLP